MNRHRYRHRYVEPIEKQARSRLGAMVSRIGGKAARTVWLQQQGLPVPPAWVIGVRPFKAVVRLRLERDLRPKAILELRDERLRTERAARARGQLVSAPLPDAMLDDLARFWGEVEERAPFGLAVRSSATSEDEDSVSLAGLAHTELGVFGPDELARAVQEVWASALLPRALSYLATRGIHDVAMAVLIEPMIEAEAAGVAFTSPPRGLLLSGDASADSEMVVNAAFGLGVPVVDGGATPDVIRVDRGSGHVMEYVCADKPRALVATRAGVREVEVAAERRKTPALSSTQLAKLAEYARLVEAGAGGRPFDLEFAVQHDEVWILQGRPAATTAFPAGGTRETVWSRANLGEALPGPATPLTWSIASTFAHHGFRRAFDALGCSVPRHARLVANVHGRFYLNLSAFMAIAGQVPGLNPKRLVELGGGFGATLLEAQVEAPAMASYLRLPWMAARLLREQSALASEVDAVEAQAERARRSLDEMDATILPDDGIVTTFRTTRTLLHDCGGLMLSCASAALASHIALRTLLDQLVPAHASALSRALVAGTGELESARPGVALLQLAAAIRRDPAARERVLQGAVTDADQLPEGPGRRALADFLARYGDRAVREVELLTPRWSEAPEPVLAMVRASLRRPAGAPDEEPEAALLRAQRAFEQALADVDRSTFAPLRPVVRALAARARHFTGLREKMRTRVSRVIAMLRKVALEIDRRLTRTHPELGKDAVFFFTFDELVDFLTTPEVDWTPIVRVRRAEYARDSARPDPAVTFVGTPSAVAVTPWTAATALPGLAASGGIVEATARVLHRGIHDADQLVAGEVLVVRSADVGLTPLFLIASAIVSEQGGPLSHAAIIAREYGVPAVVNVRGATAAIHTGDRVRVDGNRGVVERIDGLRASPIVRDEKHAAAANEKRDATS